MDEELDLHGEVCPYTFVKSKLALEEMVQLAPLTSSPTCLLDRRAGTQRPALGRVGYRSWRGQPPKIPAPHRHPRHPSSSFRLTPPLPPPIVPLSVYLLSFYPRRQRGRRDGERCLVR